MPDTMERAPAALHLLLVDDNPDDRAMVRGHLRASVRQRYVITELSNGDEVLEFLKQAAGNYPDCLILDIHMPKLDGTRTLHMIREYFGSVPLPTIVLTGSGDEEDGDFEKARQAIAFGAQDFVLKNYLQAQTLNRAVHNAIERFRLLQGMEEQKERFRLATEAASLGTWGYEPHSGQFNCSGRCRKMLEMHEGESIDYTYFMARIHDEDRERMRTMVENTLAQPAPQDFRAEYRVPTASGGIRWISARGRTSRNPEGRTRLMGTMLDISQRKNDEATHTHLERDRDRIFSVALDLMMVGNFDGGVVKVNPAWTKTLGWTEEEVRQYRWHDLIHPDDIATAEGVAAEVFAKHSTWEIDNRFRHKDGSWRWLSWRAESFPEEQIWYGAATDITARKESERALGENERRLRALTEAVPQLVWVSQPNGYYDYVSRQWLDYTGREEAELLGLRWLESVHPEDRERTRAAWMGAINGKADYNLEYRLLGRDKTYNWFKARGVRVKDDTDATVTWYGTCTDIEDQKRTETALTEARNHAEAANIAKSEFLANMSHEIRTPMNAVVGLANILSISSPLTPKQREFIRTLQLSADALLELINDLLDISKIEARTVELEHIPFSLERLMQEIVSIMSLRAKEKNLSFTMEDHGIRGRMFVGDPARLRQILMNLCSNAMKFTDQGSVSIAVECQPSEEGTQRLAITIRDSGIGIAPDKQMAIFEKFVQADSSINRKYGGTGLGLAITKTLVEIMGGRVTLESVEGRGSAFTIHLTLPCSAAAASEKDAMTTSPNAFVKEDLRPLVLLVEDYAPNVLVATTFLEQFGYAYDTASNGMEAVEKVKSGAPYVSVLMDVQMHGMNGLEATQLIREYETTHALPRLPIIGMTAHALAGDKEMCVAAGMDDYLPKPFNPNELLRKLTTHTAVKAA